MSKNKLSINYWLRKLYVSRIFQLIPIKKSFLRKLIFTSIFKSKHWVQKDDNLAKKYISISGHGSNINTEQFQNLSSCFLDFLEKFSINSILDMPCGDFLWMDQILKIKKIKYLGIDIVDDLIQKNKINYASSNIDFKTFDITNFVTEEKFDLVFMRDFFIHISNEDILRILNNISQMNIKYFASENYEIYKNINTEIGKHRKVNLQIEPFNLEKPVFSFKDYEQDKYIYFYKKDILKKLKPIQI